MQLGMVGLGRMGANLARRLMRGGHSCVVYDVNIGTVSALEQEGAVGCDHLGDLVAKLTRPRTAWVMVPAGHTRETIASLAEMLEPGDVLIDGGNTHYHDDIVRAEELKARGLHFVDVGTSGGVFGLERGYCLMIGGEADVVSRLGPIFATLSPGGAGAPRTPGRTGNPSPAELGYLHCGPAGAGHFVKMVHNGIEYGIMASYAEGLAVLAKAGIGRAAAGPVDAENTPLSRPEHYFYDLDVAEIAELWRRGSVVASWLLDLTAHALHADPHLERFQGRVSDSGEGRWTIQAAIDESVPAHVLTAALYERFSSRGKADFAGKVLSAMRKEFGGHVEQVGRPM